MASRACTLGLLLTLGFLLLPLSTKAQQQEANAGLRGFVRAASNGQSLTGANVVLRDTTGTIQAAVATDSEGFYQIVDITPGRYRLQISFVGYRPYRETLLLSGGEKRTVSISLASSAQQLEDVTVTGRRPVEEAEAGLHKVRTADIEAIPTAGPGSDLSSYLRALPSVTTTGDRGGRLYVRGGTPTQNLVLVEGLPIQKPFHILGFYSAFPGDLVSTADFYAGGFGAEYTGSISSVLDIQLRPGNTESFKASVGGGPLLVSARAEGPIQRGQSSFLVHARHSLIERTGPTLLNQKAPYKFYDVTAKYHSQGESTQCSLVGLRTYDRGRIDPNMGASFRWSNSAFGGECLLFGESSSQVLDAKFGTSRYENAVRSTDGTVRSSSSWRFYTNLDLSKPIFSNNTLEWGLHIRADQYKLDFSEPFLGVNSEEYFRITASPYAGMELTWGNQFTVNPSLGTQFQFSGGSPSLEPRLRFSYRPKGSEDMKLTAAGGLYRQYLTGISDERDAGSTFQALAPSPFQDHPLQSIHTLVGWDQQFHQHLRGSVEGWYKHLQNLPVPRWTPIVRFNTNLTRADGTAYGLDLSLQYEREWLRFGATYGYSHLTYRASENQLGAWTGESVVQYSPPYDLRHKIGVTTNVTLDWVTVSARWQYSSGLPFTQVYGFDTMLQVQGLKGNPYQDLGIPRTLYHQPYEARLPSTHRLDVSAQRAFDVSPTVSVSVKAGAINAYDRSNVFYVDIFTLDQVNQLPLIPYMSLTVNLN